MNIKTTRYYDTDLGGGGIGGISEGFKPKIWVKPIDFLIDRFNDYENQITRLKEENERLRGEGWISVEDGLPDFDEQVLIMGEARGMNPNMGGAYMFICKRLNLKGTSIEKQADRYVDENQFAAKYVTHWQPLPPPPKSKQD